MPIDDELTADGFDIMSRFEIRSTLRELLEDEQGMAYPDLDDDQDLIEGLGLDSVDVVGLVMRIERHYRIRLATEELASVRRVGELIGLLEQKLAAQASLNEGGI